jgi:hypothetical protein
MMKRLAPLALLAALGGLAWILWEARSPGGSEKTASRGAAGRAGAPVAASGDANGVAASADRREIAAAESFDATPASHAELAGSESATTIFRGRTIDERRSPIANADVLLLVAGDPPRRTRSDANGSFEIATPTPGPSQWRRTGLFASDASGRAGARRVELSSDPRQEAEAPPEPDSLEFIVLRVGARVRAHVTDARGPVPGAMVEAQVGADRVLGPVVVADGDGVAEFATLPSGPVLLLARASGRGSGHEPVDLRAAEARDVELKLEACAVIDVVVTHAVTGDPIAGAIVTLCEQIETGVRLGDAWSYRERWSQPTGISIVPTDARGHTSLELPEDRKGYSVSVRKDGLVGVWLRSGLGPVADLKPGEREVRLVLGSPRDDRLHWKIVAGRFPAPPDGTVLQLLHAKGGSERVPKTARVVDGRIEISGHDSGETFTAWATSPSGGITRLSSRDAEEYRGRSDVEFVEPRSLEVQVRDSTGRPCEGVRVLTAVDGREYDMDSAGARLVRRTDADGTARFGPLIPERRAVVVAGDEDSYPFVDGGLVDLREGDHQLECMLPAPYEVILQISIEGERRLPAELQISPGSTDLRSRRVEDPERGDIHCWFLANQRSQNLINVSLPGRLSVGVPVPLPDGGEGPILLPINLRRGGFIVLRVVKPPDCVVRPGLEVWDDQRKTFGPGRGCPSGVQGPNGPDGTYRFGPLPAGRYRAVDDVTKSVTTPIDVAEGDSTSELMLDLSLVLTIRGRIDVPADSMSTSVRLFAFDSELEPQWRVGDSAPASAKQIYLDQDRFELTLAGGHAWRLAVWHPWLRVADETGSIALTHSDEHFVLRLVDTPLVSFRAGDADPDRSYWANVAFYEPGKLDRAVRRAGGPLRQGEYVFGPAPIGTFDVLVSIERRAPVLVSGVTFDGSAKDLGTLDFERGSMLTIRPHSPTRAVPPAVYVIAQRTEPFPWVATNEPDDDGEAYRATPTFRGLPAGRYSLALYERSAGNKPSRTTEITVDGIHDAEVTIDVE